MTAAPARESPLEVRHLRVVSGDGDGADWRTVRCAADGRSIALEACLACPDAGGEAAVPAGRGAWVLCRRPPPAARAPLPERGAPMDRTPVADVMTGDVLAVRPDVSLEALTELLVERGIGGAPVVDAEGRPVGMVSMRDLLETRFVAGDTAEEVAPGWQARGKLRLVPGPGVHAEAAPRETVSDVMTPTAFTLPEDAPVSMAAALMAAHEVHRVVVVGGRGRVCGVLTASDVVRWVARRGGYVGGGAGARPGAGGTPP